MGYGPQDYTRNYLYKILVDQAWGLAGPQCRDALGVINAMDPDCYQSIRDSHEAALHISESFLDFLAENFRAHGIELTILSEGGDFPGYRYKTMEANLQQIEAVKNLLSPLAIKSLSNKDHVILNV